MAPHSAAEDNIGQMVNMPTPEEFTALQQALAEALKQKDSLAGELRVVRTERDLLKEQLSQVQAAVVCRQQRGHWRAPEGHVLQRGREPRGAGLTRR